MRDREHVRFVAKQPCLICDRKPSDPHHLRFTQHRALGRKVSDEFTVPLCRGHHREVHRCGDEAAWWRNAGIDPTACSPRAVAPHPSPAGEVRRQSSLESARTPQPPSLRVTPTLPIVGTRPELQNEPKVRRPPDDLVPADRGQPPQCGRRAPGPPRHEGKQRSRCNAVRHGPDGRDGHRSAGGCPGLQEPSKSAITAEYDAQSAVRNGNWCCGSPACCGGCAAPPRSKPAYSKSRPTIQVQTSGTTRHVTCGLAADRLMRSLRRS